MAMEAAEVVGPEAAGEGTAASKVGGGGGKAEKHETPDWAQNPMPDWARKPARKPVPVHEPEAQPAPAPTQEEIDAAAEETDEQPAPTDEEEEPTEEEEANDEDQPPRRSARPIIQRSVQLVKGGGDTAGNVASSAQPSGKAELLFLMGAGLIVISGLTNKSLNAVGDLLFNAKNMKYTRQQARQGMVILGGELLFLIILTAIAEASDTFANIALALLIGLFVVWSMINVQTSTKWVDFLTGKAKNI